MWNGSTPSVPVGQLPSSQLSNIFQKKAFSVTNARKESNDARSSAMLKALESAQQLERSRSGLRETTLMGKIVLGRRAVAGNSEAADGHGFVNISGF